jgi:hypothetical protein
VEPGLRQSTFFNTKQAIEVILDKISKDAQDEIHFAVWRAGHAMSDCDAPNAIVKAAFERLKTKDVELPDSDADEFLDRIYAEGPSIGIDAVLVINVGGRQFLVGESYADGQNVNIIHEVEKPFDFDTVQSA